MGGDSQPLCNLFIPKEEFIKNPEYVAVEMSARQVLFTETEHCSAGICVTPHVVVSSCGSLNLMQNVRTTVQFAWKQFTVHGLTAIATKRDGPEHFCCVTGKEQVFREHCVFWGSNLDIQLRQPEVSSVQGLLRVWFFYEKRRVWYINLCVSCRQSRTVWRSSHHAKALTLIHVAFAVFISLGRSLLPLYAFDSAW